MRQNPFRMSSRDKSVVGAFLDHSSASSRVLSSDGRSLRKEGLGGEKVAVWRDSKVVVTAGEGVQSDQVILRYLESRAKKEGVVYSYERRGSSASLRFHHAGNVRESGWAGAIVAKSPYPGRGTYKSMFAEEWGSHVAGLLYWSMTNGKYYIDLIEIRPEFRRSGVASALYRELFRKEGIKAKDLQVGLRTDEGKSFRKGARLNPAECGSRSKRMGMKLSDFDKKELRRGAAHELEHTCDRKLARRIAMDHLAEDPRYYEKLEKMERGNPGRDMDSKLGPRRNLGGGYAYRMRGEGGKPGGKEMMVQIYKGSKKVGHLLGVFQSSSVREGSFWGGSCLQGRGALRGDWGDLPVVSVSESEVLGRHRGRGVGLKLYQAFMAEAFNVWGPHFSVPDACVKNGYTSQAARGVWYALAQIYPSKGGLVVAVVEDPKMERENPGRDMDSKFGPWRNLGDGFSYRMKGTGPKLRWSQILVVIYKGSERIGHLLGIYHDTSDRKDIFAKQAHHGLEMMAFGWGGEHPVVSVSDSQLEKVFRGRGVGVRMYQAFMTEAFNVWGPHFLVPDAYVPPGDTSPAARRVWDALAYRYPSSDWVIGVFEDPKVERENPSKNGTDWALDHKRHPAKARKNPSKGEAGWALDTIAARVKGGRDMRMGEGRKNLARGPVVVIRPGGWESTSNEMYELFDEVSGKGTLFRGMESEEYEATLGAGEPVLSTGKYSHHSEGTCFSEHGGDAESYSNFGRSDPRKTGDPTYLVEVRKLPWIKRDSDGYFKTPRPVLYKDVVRVMQMEAQGDRIVGFFIKGTPWPGFGERKNPNGIKFDDHAQDIEEVFRGFQGRNVKNRRDHNPPSSVLCESVGRATNIRYISDKRDPGDPVGEGAQGHDKRFTHKHGRGVQIWSSFPLLDDDGKGRDQVTVGKGGWSWPERVAWLGKVDDIVLVDSITGEEFEVKFEEPFQLWVWDDRSTMMATSKDLKDFVFWRGGNLHVCWRGIVD